MKHFLIVWHESDGNDCTVFDTIVKASSEQAALNRLAKSLLHCYSLNKDALYDSSELIIDFPCDCPESEYDACEGHGGTALRSIEAYTHADDAEAACAVYHTRYTV